MSARRSDAPLLDASIRIDHIPPEGRAIEVVATPAQCEAIARRLQIPAVERLAATLQLTRFRGGMRVLGRLAAVTVQPCVVTLAPVRQAIDEPFDRVFLPAAEAPRAGGAHPEVFVDLEADELPDYFEGHEVDLAEAIVEALALALDPYPRAPGVGLADLGLPPEEDEPSPFAGLRSLLDPDGRK